jgi:hypothetical protein
MRSPQKKKNKTSITHVVIRSGFARSEQTANILLLLIAAIALLSSYLISSYTESSTEISQQFTQKYQGIDQTALIKQVNRSHDTTY